MHRIMVSFREVIGVRALQRVPKPERWNRDVLNDLMATPMQWTVPEDMEQTVVMQPRQPQINPAVQAHSRITHDEYS